MFAGKTSAILQRILWARAGLGRTVLVYKPAFDNRYSETQIVSHDGLKVDAESVAYLPDPAWMAESGALVENTLVVLDEVQFFTFPDEIPADDPVTGMRFYTGMPSTWVRTLLAAGHDVIGAGLDMDWRGMPFGVTARLAAMADEVVKLNANCTVCGRAARKTYKISQEGESVALGHSDTYEARCNEHWHGPQGPEHG
jgi:thymidine kinase